MSEHIIHVLLFLVVACVSYYAGCRGWLGKW